MNKTILSLFLVFIILLSGCSVINDGDVERTSTGPFNVGTDSTPSSPTETNTTPSPTQGNTSSTEPEYYDTYHSGKPYIPWGTPATITLTGDDGSSVTFTGNTPEETLGFQLAPWLWKGSPDHMDMSFLVAYVPASEQPIRQPDTFFEDMDDVFGSRFYVKFNVQAKGVTFDIRGSEMEYKNEMEMCRSIGVAQWVYKKLPREFSFVSYVFQTPDGGYLCCLFQCYAKDWTGTQEAAENFVNTFRWEAPNGT